MQYPKKIINYAIFDLKLAEPKNFNFLDILA